MTHQTKDDQEYSAAYDEEPQTAPVQTEDQAFGLDPEEFVDEDGAPNSPEEATEAPDEQTPMMMDAAAKDMPMMAETPAAAEPVQPAGMTIEEQRAKSWEGRQKARDAELSAGADGETGADEAGEDETAESGAEQGAEVEAEKLKGMDPDEALKALAADFGDDFASMINSIIDSKVSKASANMGESVDAIISDISDSKARAHFETIAGQFPDFMDTAATPEFKAYVASQPDGQRVVDAGSAREIVKLLGDFKASAEKPAAQEDPNTDAAEGVRSNGMRLPTQPSASSDYSAAWDEFKD